jgi:phage anti-repressor protein
MSDLTLTQVSNLVSSSEQYPVDFENAWQWLEYTRKDNALRMLKSNFQDGVEFSSLKRRGSCEGGTAIFYYLTNDCFKMLAMLAGTPRGREVRRYYIG